MTMASAQDNYIFGESNRNTVPNVTSFLKQCAFLQSSPDVDNANIIKKKERQRSRKQKSTKSMSKPKTMHRYEAPTQSAAHSEVCESTVTTAGEDIVSDIGGDAKTCNEKEEIGTCKSELQLLPPPTSWFQPEQQPDSCSKASDSDQASSGNESLSDSSESVLDDYDCTKAVAIAAANNQDDTSSVQSSDELTSSLNEALARSKISLDSVPSRTETTLSSTPTLPETLPEYDSPDAHMFDLSPLSVEEMSAFNQTNALATIDTQSPITLSAAIQTLVSYSSQTLSQTLPKLLHECSSSAIQKSIHKIRLEYNRLGPKKYIRATDIGSVGGYYCPPTGDSFFADFQESVALGKGRDDHLDWMWMDGTEVRFTTLPWIERQLVNEWRTFDWTVSLKSSISEVEDLEYDENDDVDVGEYERARTLAPRPLPQPEWELASSCYSCNRSFNATLHRHHCRRCGHSYCGAHSSHSHRLPHLGFDGEVAERVCKRCKVVLDSRDLEERVVWRLARCRDYLAGNLTPYFETGVDTVEDAAYRLTRAAISLARSIPLGAQAYVALETVEVLRKHGLKGVYGLLLRKEFLAAADLLCRVLGINKQNWPLSVHELSASIFYALAQHRALRGLKPDGEEIIHSLRRSDSGDGHDSNEPKCLAENWLSEHSTQTYYDREADSKIKSLSTAHEDGYNDEATATASATKLAEVQEETVLDETDVFNPTLEGVVDILSMSSPKRGETKGAKDSADVPPHNSADANTLPFDPVCDPVPDSVLSSLLFYAPLALDFIYAECEVDMQLLAAQQGWRLVFASLDQNHNHAADTDGTDLESDEHFSDKPASALFAHDELKIACLSVRGTATIQDVVTDIRAMPVQFPQQIDDGDDSRYSTTNSDWTSVSVNKGLALCGMAGAAVNHFRETADSLIHLARNGYKIRIVGHSLGGAVAMLLGVLMLKHIDKNSSESFKSVSEDDDFLRVYGYGTPSCVDASLADSTRSFVTNVVLHDDVVPRLTPTSIRGLLKHLLYIRETWVKTHLSDDLHAITERAYHVWPTRLRGSFTLLKQKGFDSAKKLKKSCKKRLREQKGLSSAAAAATTDNHNHKCDNERDENSAEVSDTAQGVNVEGDLFFDPADPLNESDDESSVNEDTSKLERVHEWVPFDEPPMDTMSDASEKEQSTNSLDQNDDKVDSDSGIFEQPQILEEMPLPRMFIPGKIVHIYTHRGGYKAAYVPRKFRKLRRISLAGNMLSDHMANAYYASLLEVKAIRSAKVDLPTWVGFAEDCTCACCASLFTWASTSNTEAQAARDKHNCRACGSLVCEPCSKKRVPIPALGIPVPVRVCDRCYNGWGNLFSGAEHDECAKQKCEPSRDGDKPIHSRRSVVVDELASRIPAIQS